PVGVHLQASPRARRFDVLLERVEVAHGRRPGYGREEPNGFRLEDVGGVALQSLRGSLERPTVPSQEIEQANARGEGPDPLIGEQADALPAFAIQERGPSHGPHRTTGPNGGCGLCTAVVGIRRPVETLRATGRPTKGI